MNWTGNEMKNGHWKIAEEKGIPIGGTRES